MKSLKELEYYFNGVLSANINLSESIEIVFKKILNKFYFNFDIKINDFDLVCIVNNFISQHLSLNSFKNINDFKFCLIYKLLINLNDNKTNYNFPYSIIQLYPEAINRTANFLIDNFNNTYNEDYFMKDLCFVTGNNVPCGAQVVELNSYISFYRFIRSIIYYKNFYLVSTFFNNGGPGKWLRIHTEERYIDDFNEQGWNSCYYRISELLMKFFEVKGVVGTSWFYDPSLINISPRLAYLQRVPLDNGAFMIHHRTSHIDIVRATLKSKTRKKLFEDGIYNPKCCSIIWPRDNLIIWANKYKNRTNDIN